MARSERGGRRLVTAYLEGVSWSVFEQYPEVVRELIRGHAGVYALYKRDRLYYVGLASNLMSRIKQHLRDRHHGSWDRFSVYLTLDDRHMKELESLLIRIADPHGNRMGGKFARASDIKRELHRRMREADADKRARLLGGRVQRQRQKRKSATRIGAAALAGVLDRAKRLRGERDGWIYTATLRKDGRISYDGKLYGSPSAAAKAAVGRSANGWTFWKFRDPRKGWIRLAELRR